MKEIIALIPARAGSQRVKGKNIKKLAGHPLIAYTIRQAQEAEIFKRIFVSTESPKVAAIAKRYGAEVIIRPKEFSTDLSPDHEWVNDALYQLRPRVPIPEVLISNEKLTKDSINKMKKKLENMYSGPCSHLPEILREGKTYHPFDAYAILRPTCPFRKPSSIQTAWSMLQANPSYDSIRAIRVSYDHPYKMWHYWKFDNYSGRIEPIMPRIYGNAPAYDMPTQQFDIVWSQSAALQIHLVGHTDRRDISGPKIMGIMLGEYEAHDINTPRDWFIAEQIAKHGKASLPRIPRKGWLSWFTR